MKRIESDNVKFISEQIWPAIVAVGMSHKMSFRLHETNKEKEREEAEEKQ